MKSLSPCTALLKGYFTFRSSNERIRGELRQKLSAEVMQEDVKDNKSALIQLTFTCLKLKLYFSPGCALKQSIALAK